MATPSRDLLAQIEALNGEPRVTYPTDSTDYPVTERVRNLPIKDAIIAYLTPEPDTTRFANLVLVEQSILSKDRTHAKVYRKYKKITGPIIASRGVGPGGLIKVETTQDVAASTVPDYSGGAVADNVRGDTVVEGVRFKTYYTNPDGTAASAPIHAKIEYVDEIEVERTTFRQQQTSPGTPPAIDAEYSTGGVKSGGAVTAITVDTGGHDYKSVALVSVAKGPGVRALATAIMGADAVEAILNPGFRFVPGETMAFAGGTGTAPVLTCSRVGLGNFINLAPTSIGTGITPNQHLTLGGGTFSVAGVISVDACGLATLAIDAGGSDYTAGDILTLVGGTGDEVAKVHVLSVSDGAVFSIQLTGTGTSRGQYTGSLPASFTCTGGTGTGATFNSPTWGVATNGGTARVSVVTRGNYTVTATTLTHASSGFSATASADTWGIVAASVNTAGALSALPPLTLASATYAKRGLGYKPLELLTLSGGTGTPPVVMVRTVVGTASTGPVGLVTVQDDGSITALPFTTDADGQVNRANWTVASVLGRIAAGTYVSVDAGTNEIEVTGHGRSVGDAVAFDSTADNPGGISKARAYFVKTVVDADHITITTDPDVASGTTFDVTAAAGSGTITMYVADVSATGTGTPVGAGAEFTGTYDCIGVNLIGSGSGDGASIALSFAVASITVGTAGTKYPSAPAVTISGSDGSDATATAAVAAITIASTAGKVIDRWTETIPDSPLVWANWVTMPVPGTQTLDTSEHWVRPGRLTVITTVANDPPRPGIDFVNYPQKSAEFPTLIQKNYQFGPFTREQMFIPFSLTVYAAGSRFFPIDNNTIHDAIAWQKDDGSYAEIYPASVMTGAYGGLICISCKQLRVAGSIYCLISKFVNANG